ncbi:MAG: three-Cys-motif partner protein TcmP [Opitutaceae bacterium]|nr:three-Cys-motif partner protein TcmP [Opitutaceae bacterium]
MTHANFHAEAYDSGTLTKLKIFELYAQEWIPVFVSNPDPPFREIHLYDFFCGPGTDAAGVPGSPLRILGQLRKYQEKGMADWLKVRIVAHLSDQNERKIRRLAEILKAPEWQIPGVQIEAQAISFKNALQLHRNILTNPRAAKLLIIDQFGVDEVTDAIFKQLTTFPKTDFIFFLSSSTLHRFRTHPAIKIKIEKPEDSYDVHRAAFDWFQKLAPSGVFLGRFSIRKRSNIYGLIFGSQHPLGIHKFLQVAWSNDEIAGEANFDIERENIRPDELMLPMKEFRPQKIQVFESELEAELRAGAIRSETDLVRFCITAGMTCQHAKPVLQKLRAEGEIECEFHTPNVRNCSTPRPIRIRRFD